MHESARLHELLSKTHLNEPGMLRLPHGRWTKSPEGANEHLMDVHFPGCCIDRTIKNINASITQPAKHRWIPSVNWNVAGPKILRNCYCTLSNFIPLSPFPLPFPPFPSPSPFPTPTPPPFPFPPSPPLRSRHP